MVYYSFDTSAFINGRRDLYRPENFPTLWSFIEDTIQAGQVRSTEIVRDELSKKDDDTWKWTRRQDGLFLSLDEPVIRATKGLLRAYENLTKDGSGRNAADPFVIALAIVHRGKVVTEEKARSLENPRIPDVCAGLGVPCINLADFISEQAWTF